MISAIAINGAFRTFGVPASYQPPAGDALPCRVIVHQGGPADEAVFGPVKLAKEASLIEVRTSEVAAPLAGGTFTIGSTGTVFEVDADPVRLDPDRRVWTCSVDSFATIIYRIATGSGATLNPPSGSAFKVAVDVAAGASVLTIGGASLPTGQLLPGDTITIGSTTHTVTAPVSSTTATGNKFVNVPVTPALVAPVAANTPVTLAFACDHPLKALVSGYTTVELSAGANVADRRAVMMHSAFVATGLPEPSTLHSILLGGKRLSIKAASASYRGDAPYAWELRAGA